MSSGSGYQVIARKWRPQTFDEVTGQGHVTTALRNAIRSDRVPHALLLTGPRGTGKTTLARILAKCLNCEKGPTDTPCGSCASCVEITRGSSTDVQEIDAASRTSVDDVRELIESIRYAAAPGRHRIFVVDEVHMLSTAAFNALLKTLEEPPPRSLFVFATTNPEKIPFTVLSRCQRYDLRRIPRPEVAARLRQIAEAEEIQISDSSLLAIAREGEGSMRDSQTLLDQVIAYAGRQIPDETVTEVLDLIDRRVLLGLTEACLAGDPATALEACHRAAEAGADPRRLARELLQLLRDLVVLRMAPERPELVEGAPEEVDELRRLAEREEPARLRRMFRALLKELEELAFAPQPAAVLEMALVRLATLPAGDDVARLIARIDALERRLSGGGGDGGSEPGGGATRGGAGGPGGEPGSGAGVRRRGGPPSSPGGNGRRRTRAADDRPGPPAAIVTRGDESVPEVVPATPTLSARPAAATPMLGGAAATTPESGALGGDASDAQLYDRIRSVAQTRNRGLFASLDGGCLRGRGADQLRIEIPGRFHARRLASRVHELEEICAEILGRSVRIQIEEGLDAAGRPGAARADRGRELRRAALGNQAINSALKTLRGEIVEIRPLDSPGASS